ncbi:MAG: DUF3592 domain-containing protein [Proteobacteria bacterium]|nr:DUF3592 domain-containing protein [Pseudomonadota bacterium]
MAELFMTLVVLAGVAAFFISRFKREARKMQALLERGEIAKAEIVEVKRQRRSRIHDDYFVAYAFSTRDGRRHTQRNRVTPGDFQCYVEGEKIDVVYDPHDPAVSMIKLTVDEARRAMSRSAIS